MASHNSAAGPEPPPPPLPMPGAYTRLFWLNVFRIMCFVFRQHAGWGQSVIEVPQSGSGASLERERV